ncbi:MAG: HAMP domain-containing sensor histidine kinase [Gemmatimonadota bacterium]
MTLRAKLVLGFSAVAVVLLVPSLFAAHRLGILRDLAVDGRFGQAAAVAGIGRMQALANELDRMERSFIATADPTLREAALATLDSLEQAYGRFSASPYGAEGTTIREAIDEVGAVAFQIDGLMGEQRLDEATDMFPGLVSGLERLDRALTRTATAIDVRATEDARNADAVSRAATLQTFIGIAVALLLTVILASVTTHTLTSPVRRLSRAMARVADGGFEAPPGLPYHRTDEIGELSMSFATMTRRLADLDRTKSEFFGVVSHELKTPLNVIGAYAEILTEDLGPRTAKRHKRLIDDISEQSRVMVKLVSRLMDISRLAAGTYEIAPERADVPAFLLTLERAWTQRATDKGVTFSLNASAATPVEIGMDIDIIRDEVLGNLLGNALRYTPTGGRIEVDVDGCAGGIVFTVTDTGPGIPEEHRELVFQKHYVVDRRSAVGSGLGLAIAKEMVELHGGRITLEPPAPGRGARFVVALPRVPITDALDVLPV